MLHQCRSSNVSRGPSRGRRSRSTKHALSMRDGVQSSFGYAMSRPRLQFGHVGCRGGNVAADVPRPTPFVGVAGARRFQYR
ncbi:hypothetical protein GWI33_011400 [Rhynchophorus ferrugineus]|uniref:Uncharacterized protein n=1 Tax=Rhynchophorus ferrugineus TaxID=354439 RepID=A0A834MK17_RHYFE|nr:hypothetical protein GWI33_011400 [Rhynchophorus ferrugineus]